MYLYDRELRALQRSGDIPESPAALSTLPFGEPVGPPKGLVLLDHFHSPKQPDPTTPGRLITGSVRH
jgi:hypothetical protein